MPRYLEKLTGLLGRLLARLRRPQGPSTAELWEQAWELAEAERAKILRGWPLLTTAGQELAYYRVKDTLNHVYVWSLLEKAGVDVGNGDQSG